MRQALELRSGDAEKIEYLRWHHEHSHVRQKMWALHLKVHGEKHTRICKIVGITRNTLLSYLREYNAGGIESVCTLKFYAPSSKLSPYREQLKTYFESHPPSTAAQAQKDIERETGIHMGRTQVRAFMHELGMSFRKTACVPAKADSAAQEEFKKKCWSLALQKSRKGNGRFTS